jgi:hypothetical protein
MSQFVAQHVFGIKNAEGVIKTLLTAFDHVQIWTIGDGADLVVVAGKKPLSLTPEEVVGEISEYKLSSGRDLGASLTYADRNAVLELIKQSPDIPLYTDDVITLELAAIDGFLHKH